MGEPAQLSRSSVRTLTLLVGFAAFIATFPLLAISLNAFVAVAAVVLVSTNIIFLREFGIRRFITAATLLAFNLFVADVAALIVLAFLSSDSGASDYLLSAMPLLAVVNAVLQAFFVRDHW